MSTTASSSNTSAHRERVKSDKHKRSNKLNELPNFDWISERPNLSMDFLEKTQEPLSIVLPFESQESAIINDLLICFLGRNGDFIVANPLSEPYGNRTFSISSSINSKLGLAAQKSLVLASHYSMVVRFIQNNCALEVGRANQALAASIDKIVDDYCLQIGRLEVKVLKNSLNIQSLYHAIQPLLDTMSLLSSISYKVAKKGARGGKTLSILYHFYSVVPPGSINQDVVLNLLTHSSKPYLESVQQWIFHGIIFDPYDEFMIVENHKIHLAHDDLPDEYWLKKYQIRKNLVPNFLERVAEQILNSGKYLNVGSHCVVGNLSLDLAEEKQLEFTLSAEYNNIIENAFKFSSKYLLNILLSDFNIIDRMKSLKRYFLLQQGDFITTVFDISYQELNKLICDIIPSRFAALVDIAIRVPSTNDDPYRELISLNLKQLGLVEQVMKILNINTNQEFIVNAESMVPLMGIDAFALSIKSQWPVSLIFNKKVISCYQMLFRHLTYIKFIEQLLFKVWLHDMTLKKRLIGENFHLYKSFGLRNKMISFVQNMAYYMMEEIIEPYWIDLISKIPNLESVDDLLKEHWMFVDHCMRDCLLSDLTIFRNFRDILTICKHFTEYIAQYEKKSNEISSSDFENNINLFEIKFDDELDKFLKKITKQVTENNNKMFSILYRFDALSLSGDFAD